jgi:superfamily I DNA/RNA helicase
LPTRNTNTVEDERRLFFVAVSRAKQECHLAGCRSYQNRVLTPSRFAMETGVYQEPDETLIDQAIQEAITAVNTQEE